MLPYFSAIRREVGTAQWSFQWDQSTFTRPGNQKLERPDLGRAVPVARYNERKARLHRSSPADNEDFCITAECSSVGWPTLILWPTRTEMHHLPNQCLAFSPRSHYLRRWNPRPARRYRRTRHPGRRPLNRRRPYRGNACWRRWWRCCRWALGGRRGDGNSRVRSQTL